jgi:hypothetical protein
MKSLRQPRVWPTFVQGLEWGVTFEKNAPDSQLAILDRGLAKAASTEL